MALSDFDYYVTDEWVESVSGKSFLNVYWYQGLAVFTPSAEDLLAEFADTLVAAVATILSVTMDHGVIRVINRTDDEDFAEDFVADSGERTGEPMPNLVAASLSLGVANRSFRTPSHRYGAISEADITQNGFASGYETILNAVAATVLTQALNSGTNVYSPVAVKTVVVPNDPPATGSHREPIDFTGITGFNPWKVSSQRSRRP